MAKTKEEIIYELVLSLNISGQGYVTEHGDGSPRINNAIAQYEAFVKKGIIKETND